MPTLFATCGLAFSGKSTFANRLAEALQIERISLDEINASRGLDGGKGMTDAQWEETSLMAASSASQILESGRSLVLDDTLSHRFLRDRYRKAASHVNARFILFFFDTPLKVIEQRIEQNRLAPVRHHINSEVFSVHKKRFQFPTDDEETVRFRSTDDADQWLRETIKRP